VKAGGSLLISELCSHDQSWTREACGDLWLGFDQDDLARWAIAAGLVPGESLYIGFKNGFQIQLRHFARPDSRSTLTDRSEQDTDRSANTRFLPPNPSLKAIRTRLPTRFPMPCSTPSSDRTSPPAMRWETWSRPAWPSSPAK